MITIGDVRTEMARELGESLQAVVDKKKRLDRYFILVHTTWEGASKLKTRLIVLAEKPKVPMLGTMLYEINNREGSYKREWVLPRDIELEEHQVILLESEKIIEDVLRSSAKLNNILLRGLH